MAKTLEQVVKSTDPQDQQLKECLQQICDRCDEPRFQAAGPAPAVGADESGALRQELLQMFTQAIAMLIRWRFGPAQAIKDPGAD